LEVHDFIELAPSFGQIIGALQTLFAFVSLILFIIVSFTIANTMGMAVMERVNEIGTARAPVRSSPLPSPSRSITPASPITCRSARARCRSI
jgi:hypothetical protein